MRKYSREFDGDGSKFKYGSKSVLPVDKKMARWIVGCTLGCWLVISFIGAASKNDIKKFGVVTAMPLIMVSQSPLSQLYNLPMQVAGISLLFAGLGVFVFVKGIKWASVALMVYFILCLVPWLALIIQVWTSGTGDGQGP